jgi:hypothetical protein
MKRELEDDLARKWPEVFTGRALPVTGDLVRFECQHGDGWYALLDALCEVLVAHAREIGREPLQALQIYEEMGVLEFDIREAQDEFQRGAIWASAGLSGRICEMTGAPGHPFVCGGYIRTLAPEVAERHRFRIPKGFSPAPLPPVPWSWAFGELEPETRGALVGTAEVPPGWADIASLVLQELGRPLRNSGLATARVFALVRRNGELLTEVENPRERDLGTVAFVQAVSRHVDPETGAAYVPDLD